ncbi:MAG: hypothetical protein R2706_12465 [Acidimicrobiales bacterium]
MMRCPHADYGGHRCLHPHRLISTASCAPADLLLQHRTDYDAAVGAFTWPELANFNWATDYFDHIASGNVNPALHIVEETGEEARLTYAELSARSGRWPTSSSVWASAVVTACS